MTISPQVPPHEDEFEALMADMQRAVDRSLAGPPRLAATPPPPNRQAPGAGQLWGPSSPPVTSSLHLLVQVADNARVLQNQLLAVVENLIGEAPAIRARQVQKLPSALLPAVSALATEIDVVHAEIGQLLAHVKGKLS